MALTKEDNALINEWNKVKTRVAEIKATLKPDADAEFKLRGKVKALFENIVEGSKNALDLGNGYSLKMKQDYTRKVDTASVATLSQAMVEAQVPVSMLFRVKYDLDLTIYRKLTPEQKALVDQTFTLTEDAPTIELITPKPQDQA